MRREDTSGLMNGVIHYVKIVCEKMDEKTGMNDEVSDQRLKYMA